MRKICAALIASAALAYSPAAHAVEVFTPADPEFSVDGDALSGTDVVTGGIEQVGLTGSDVHQYLFQIGPVVNPPAGIGLGTGSITTTFTVGSGNSLTFNSVSFNNGVDPTYIAPIIQVTPGFFVAGLTNIPIYSGVVNTLSVDYTATGEASYGAQLTFTPGGIPEPTTWAMMLIGFAAVGFAMRRRRRNDGVRVRYAF